MARRLNVPEILRARSEDVAEALLREYFGPEGTRTAYSGAHFETLGGRWDELPPDEITASDLLAVSTLSVDVPASATIRILGPEVATISRLLRSIPADTDLPDAPDNLVDGGAAADLWALLRAMPGMGPTTTSKLLARKRPRLVPIYDSVVATVFGARNSGGYWRAMRDLVHTDGIWQRAEQLRTRAAIDPVVTPLRVIDVVVWMHGRHTSTPKPGDGAEMLST